MPFDDREVAREALRGSERPRDPARARRGRRALPGRLVRAGVGDQVTGVQIDSRRIEEGDLFVAVGRRRRLPRRTRSPAAPRRRSCPSDAHASLAALGRRGARPLAAPASSASPARSARRRPRTSWPRSAARTRATVAAEASYNNELGVPLTLCRLEPDTEVCIARAGDARLRPDRRALRDRPAARRRRHERRARCTWSCVGSLEASRARRPSCSTALPAGGVAVRARAAPSSTRRRDDLDVRRFGEGGDARCSSSSARATARTCASTSAAARSSSS